MRNPVSQFQSEAALWVIRAVDVGGTNEEALEVAFRSAVTSGRFPRLDLDGALSLLLDRGLLRSSRGRTEHVETLTPLLSLSDPALSPLLFSMLRAHSEMDVQSNEDERSLLGARGEDEVHRWCVTELVELGQRELVSQVQRVSLVSDRFGFDISAPSLRADSRMLEVKTSSSPSRTTFAFFISRNEYEVGKRNPERWSLVACQANADTVSVLGWCRASELERYLPDDGNGRWTEAQIRLPSRAFLPGVPSAVS